MLIGNLLEDQSVLHGPVLVVDDDVAVRTAIDAALSAEGYAVVTAEDGEKALELASSRDVGLILLDIRMPRMDGPEFARAYAALPGPRAPTVVLSAADDAASWARRIGAAGHLDKPFDLDELLELVARYTGRRIRFD